MTAFDLKARLDNYNQCETQRSWIKTQGLLSYENEYLSVVRVDSSNKWVGQDKMEKMWSIIFVPKKSFISLPNYRTLKSVIDITVTPVTHGKLKGYYGLRIYGMKRDPNENIVKEILDFIFS